MKNKHTNILTATIAIISILTSLAISSEDTFAEHSISISASETETIDVSVSGNGTSISETQINVATTCTTGYNFAISTSANDNNLYLDGNSTNNNAGSFFSPSDGTTSLISANNTWGFYLSNSTEDVPTANSIFSAVPTLENPIAIKTPASTASDTAIDDTFSIYYGVKISNDLPVGRYTMADDGLGHAGTIVYYATLPQDCFRYTIVYNPTGTGTGEEITGTGAVENQIVAEGVTTNLTEDVYGNPTVDDVLYHFIGWNTAQDGTGTTYVPGQEITDLTTAGETIVLYAQWAECLAGNVCYFKNHTAAEGSMGLQEVTSNTDVSLLAPNYSLSSHGFIGWSEDRTASVKLANGEAVTIYGPNETINSGDLSIKGKALYAVWVEATETMQEWNSCDELEIGDVLALQDARDDNTYGVAKLSDGKCWMIENLRLESADSVGEKASLAQGYNPSFTGLANSENGNFADSTTPNSLYSTDGSTSNVVSGNYIGTRFPRYNNTNTHSLDGEPTQGSDQIFGYGNYYTWAAVVADTTASNSLNTAVETTSICPTGWHIPKGGNKSIEEDNDYWKLVVDGINGGVKPVNYGSSNRPYYYDSVEGTAVSELLKRFPNNIVQSGYYSGSSASGGGSVGRYWTSVTSINNGAYMLNMERERVDPGTYNYPKYYGFTVRCLYSDND